MQLNAIDVSPIARVAAASGRTPEQEAKKGISGFFAQLPQMITAGLTISNAQRLANLNFSRIKAGQPALTQPQIQSMTPGINIGLAPDIKNMLLIGGLALGGILLFTMMPKRK